MRYGFLLIALLVGTGAFGMVSMRSTAADGRDKSGRSPKVDFNKHIRPILSHNCFQCHGPDDRQRKADLRLDVRAGAFADLGGYKAIVPGDTKKSELYRRITAKKRQMPPKRTNKKLTQREKDLIKRWIEQGAQWEEHWAFVTPKKAALPAVKNKDWCRNAIDYFILARLEKAGLKPSPEADRRTLIRRVTLDLTGLPPTPAEVEAFVNDKSPNAYEKVVDRLLNSDHYGEHMARFWLDAARYGDTHGMHLDNFREMWPYRDWVINAFNKNLPYDRFIIDQLGGDLLPNPTLDEVVATGFNRCHVSTNEGGSIAEEVYVRNVVDRVETTGTVFLGLTIGCAVCHEHKFDPISQTDFYQLFAFFNSLDGRPMDGNASRPPPIVRVPSLAQKHLLAKLKDELAKVQNQLDAKIASFKYVEPKNPKTPTLPEPKEIVWIDDDLPAGAKANGNTPWKWVAAPKPVLSGKKASTRTAKGLSQHFFDKASQTLTITKGDKLFAYVYLDPKNPPKEIMLQWNDGQWEHRAYWGGNRIAWGKQGSPSRRPIGKLPKKGQWVRLEVDAAHVGLNPGAKLNGWAFTQFDGTVYWDKAGVVRMPDPSQLQFDSLVQWEGYQRKLKSSSLPKDIQAIIKLDQAKRTSGQKKQLTEYFIAHVYDGSRKMFEPLHRKIDQINKQMANLEKQFGATLVWKETAKPRPAYVLKRGQYDQRGKQVHRDTPKVLPPMGKDLPKNRLGFAKWLVNPQHPLTTRVAVNRFWQQFFGTGIVKTSEDFGNQGEPPSHPKLLDWLAVDFRENGWDVKRLNKMIVMSATYRQSSKVTPELLKNDPGNRLLARGPRVRLDAEMLRDQVLAVSGLLVRKIGGPSVKPPQPAGLWFAVGYSGSNTVRFKQDTDPVKLYRRSVYTFWKRTSAPPQMTLLDAPSRESCKMRRERTNTPLQALLMMNEQQFVEASRYFGGRILREGGKTPQQRAAWAFHLVTARPPSAMELKELVTAYQDFRAQYQKNPKAAQLLIRYGDTDPDRSFDPVELASWTMVANVVLNLDEVIMKN